MGVDIKVTSIRQPQSSCPFRDATQKIYGLGYNLLVFVYDKADDDALRSARLDFKYVLFIDESLTGDFQTTTGLLRILSNGGNVDDVDRHLPLDEVSRRELAARIVTEPPKAGCLTISNALQWRLQYSRAIQMAEEEGAGLVPWNLLA